jgi:tetratricopeptide (TPR) repeat protein
MQKSISFKTLFFLLLLSGGQAMASIDPANLTSDGEKAFAAKDFTSAADCFAKALKYTPEDLRARFRYGQALFSLKRFNESHQQFQAILQNSPNNIIARIFLAENLVQLKRVQEARTHVEWILKVQPEHERARQILTAITSGKAVVDVTAAKPTALPEKMPQSAGLLPVKENQTRQKKPEFVARPFVAASAGQNSAAVKITTVAAKIPAAPAQKITGLGLDNFIETVKGSFLVNLENARFQLENGEAVAAGQSLAVADELARSSRDTRRFLEVQILKSLVFVYTCDFKSFCQHLMALKPILSKESYQSFLDIYNQGNDLKDPADRARLAAGIAMGAGHSRVAASLFAQAFKKYPQDPLIANLLADAQIQSLDYRGAEATLAHLARTDQKSAEAYFNLARFYLTVFYKPDQARSYAAYAASLKPEDARIAILQALLDYCEGKVHEGMQRVSALLPSIDDPEMQAVCKKIMADGKMAEASSGKSRINFASVLALPGAPHAPASSYRILGEDLLRQGSFFSALKYFSAAQDLAETGRTYLGIASALMASGEADAATNAVAFGLQALEKEIATNPGNGRAHLYMALYHHERGDMAAAKKSLERGLASDCETQTRQRITAVLNTINNS